MRDIDVTIIIIVEILFNQMDIFLKIQPTTIFPARIIIALY